MSTRTALTSASSASVLESPPPSPVLKGHLGHLFDLSTTDPVRFPDEEPEPSAAHVIVSVQNTGMDEIVNRIKTKAKGRKRRSTGNRGDGGGSGGGGGRPSTDDDRDSGEAKKSKKASSTEGAAGSSWETKTAKVPAKKKAAPSKNKGTPLRKKPTDKEITAFLDVVLRSPPPMRSE